MKEPNPQSSASHPSRGNGFNAQKLALVAVTFIFLTLMILNEITYKIPAATPTPNITVTAAVMEESSGTVTPTPLPQEWLENSELTNGIVLGGVLLVLIIIVGTLGAIRRRT